MADETLAIAPSTELSGDAALRKVRSLIGKFHSAMMVTFTAGHQIHVRPMAPSGAGEDFDGVLWFFTDDRSQKIHEVDERQVVSLIFQDDASGIYVHLLGRGSITRSRARLEEFYTPAINRWFPEGLNDPHLVLLRVDIDRGEFWDAPGGMLRTLVATTKAAVTGIPQPSGDVGTLII